MSDDKQKQYKTEWSFSFDKLNEQIGDFVKSIGVPDEEVVKHETLSALIDGATSARVQLDLSVGETTVGTLADPTTLITADVTYVGDIKFTVTGDQDKYVHLGQDNTASSWFRNALGFIGSSRKLKWEVALSPSVPTVLDINGGVGKMTFNLTDLNVTSLSIRGGTGEIDATLPAKTERYTADVNAGVGETSVKILPNTSVDLNLRTGTGEINVNVGEGAFGTLKINVGIGGCNLRLPAGAAIRLEAKTGIGDVSIHGHHLQQVRGGEEFISKQGVWETPNYATADKQIAIKFEGGIGGLDIR